MPRKKGEIVDGKRVCTKCGEEKEISEYYKNGRGFYFAECKECNKGRMKERYNKDPKKIKEINQKWLSKLTDEEYDEFKEKVKAKRRKPKSE